MLNNSSNVLDDILQVGKTSGNMKGIGFDYDTVNKEIKIPTKKFVSPEKKTEFVMLDHMSQHPVRHLNPQPRNKKKPPWIFHNCGRDGHIRPYCYKLYGYPQPHDQPKVSGKIVQARKDWKPKTPNSSLNVDKSVSVSAFKTAIAPDVASNVTTSLAQSNYIKFESESESAFDSGKSQCKMVPVCDEKDGLESDDQSVWSFLLF